MKILIINGPNLNYLGKRKPEIYGRRTLDELNEYIRDSFKEDTLDFFQSNYEGAIIDKIQEAPQKYNGIVLNAGAFTHYSYAIRDAIEACEIPVVETHLSNTAARENFRSISVISEVCSGTVAGFGMNSYILAVEGLKRIITK
jgi:3-dehydroquinate dehydratase-2